MVPPSQYCAGQGATAAPYSTARGKVLQETRPREYQRMYGGTRLAPARAWWYAVRGYGPTRRARGS
eukprot:581233-Rhodomonas_salina.1